MRILFDYQAFSMQRFGGISRYFEQLYTGLETAAGMYPEIAVKYAQNDFLPSKYQEATQSLFHQYRGRGCGKIFAFADHLNRKVVRTALLQDQFTIFHPTYYQPYFTSWPEARPFVITVHDMIHEKFPHLVGDPQAAVNKERTILAADHLICVSQATKSDLLELLPVDEDKVTVIHHGAPFSGEEMGNPNLNLPGKYFLHVGNRLGYKNFEVFARAFAALVKRDQTIRLVCSGGGDFNPSEKTLLSELGISHLTRYVSASPENLVTLYRDAMGFVFPSRYEGFGFPLLEAFAFGCPVIAAATPALQEVGGEAAVYFSPDSSEELEAALSALLADASYREVLAARGRERALLFSWETCVNRHADLYRQVAKACFNA